MTRTNRPTRATGAALLWGTLLLAASAQAQVYRVVGPDGRVTYSDTPPAQPARELAANANAPAAAALPYALARIAQRYPVTLYAAQDCAPCHSGRNLLIQRGVPFSEKTVELGDDVAALRRLAGASSLPVLTIGAQRIQGYTEAEWTQYLDAAAYPSSSQLPASYQRPAPTPLAGAAPAATQAALPASAPTATPAAAPVQPSVAPARNQANPAGIRF